MDDLGRDLRAALYAQTAHSVQATVAHVHALILDLHHPALEVLLVEQHDLKGGMKEGMEGINKEHSSQVSPPPEESSCFLFKEGIRYVAWNHCA